MTTQSIADRIAPGAILLDHAPLTGGVSARVEALTLRLPDGTVREVVLRQHGAAAWKALEDDVTVMEHRLLTALHGAGVAVPAPLFLDTACDLRPAPYMVMERVSGGTGVATEDLPAALEAMADFLAMLHALPTASLPPLPRRDDLIAVILEYLPALPEEAAIRTAISAHVPAEGNPPALLHGDFWSGNILWQDGEIAAVIDWEDAAIGDPLCDLAGARIELLWAHGPAAMAAFTDQYLARTALDTNDLPLWDLYVGSAGYTTMDKWGLPEERVEVLRGVTLPHLHQAASVLLR